MNVLQYYGLNQEPFSNTPATKFFFDSKQSKNALMRVQRGIAEMKGLALVVGDVGTGKTTLARYVLDSLEEDQFEAALLVVIHSAINADWLVKRIAQQLGVQAPSEDRLVVLTQLYQRLVEIHESGKKAVVIIDEAQMLRNREIMEEIRGILNLELPDHKLITFVLFGLPDVEKCLAMDPPLAQRVAVKATMHPLDLASTHEYVFHRLHLAGASRVIFDPKAIAALYQFSGGSPRLINTLADNSLFEGAITQSHVIDHDIVERVAADLGLVKSVLHAIEPLQPSAKTDELPSNIQREIKPDISDDSNPSDPIDQGALFVSSAASALKEFEESEQAYPELEVPIEEKSENSDEPSFLTEVPSTDSLEDEILAEEPVDAPIFAEIQSDDGVSSSDDFDAFLSGEEPSEVKDVPQVKKKVVDPVADDLMDFEDEEDFLRSIGEDDEDTAQLLKNLEDISGD